MLKKPITIKNLQNHIKTVDFAEEKNYEVVLKLFEEVGELSVEMRKAHVEGLNQDIKENIMYELYDVVHYVTYIANLYGIDLEEAIIKKDQINEKRYQERSENHD